MQIVRKKKQVGLADRPDWSQRHDVSVQLRPKFGGLSAGMMFSYYHPVTNQVAVGTPVQDRNH